MSFSEHINLISVFLIGVFILPLVCGMFRPLTGARIFHSFNATVSALVVILSAILSVSFTNFLFSNNGDNALANLFKNIEVIRYSLLTQDVFVYAMIFLVVLIGLIGLFQLLLIPLNKKVFVPLSEKLGEVIASTGRGLRYLAGGLWQFPKSVWLVLVFALLFNFYAVLSSNAALGEYINASSAYKLVDDHAIQPLISSDTVKQIPVFINNTVDKAVECLSPEGRRLLIKVYINGVTVEEGVQSSPDIDNVAIDLVGTENNRYEMAEILYEWVANNISYDHDKAEIITDDAFGTVSGAVPAFTEGAGVCFDKACLYVAMCRAVGVGVRLVTGEGFNGSEWLDHSWNEIYDDAAGRWVNVDTTFGGPNSDYFDNGNFALNHRNTEIHGEWPSFISYG